MELQREPKKTAVQLPTVHLPPSWKTLLHKSHVYNTHIYIYVKVCTIEGPIILTAILVGRTLPPPLLLLWI